jgi:transcriptional regulator with XRE-family HTH domain
VSLVQPDSLDGTERPNTEALMATVGQHVHLLRKARHLTLEELGRQSKVSTGLISQIERGRGNPSFNTLVQVAHALDVPVARLLHTAEENSPVVRANERRVLDIHNSGGIDALHELLTPGLDRALEAIWVEAPPGYDTSDTPFSHPGEEFGLVLEGRHEVWIAGTRHELGPGDSVAYSSTLPHWYRNRGPEPVKAVWVITPPTF